MNVLPAIYENYSDITHTILFFLYKNSVPVINDCVTMRTELLIATARIPVSFKKINSTYVCMYGICKRLSRLILLPWQSDNAKIYTHISSVFELLQRLTLVKKKIKNKNLFSPSSESQIRLGASSYRVRVFAVGIKL